MDRSMYCSMYCIMYTESTNSVHFFSGTSLPLLCMLLGSVMELAMELLSSLTTKQPVGHQHRPLGPSTSPKYRII